MERYDIEENKKVLKNHQNSTIWNTVERCDICFVQIPTMKPLD